MIEFARPTIKRNVALTEAPSGEELLSSMAHPAHGDATEGTGLTDDAADFSYTFDAVVDVCADCNGYVLSARRSESATS